MICGSRAPRGSSALLALVALLVGLLAGRPEAWAQEPALAGTAWPPRLELAADASLARQLEAEVARDRRWLARQPAWRLALPAPDDSLAVLTFLRLAERSRTAAIDSVASIGGRQPARGQRSLLAELRDRWLGRGFLDVAVSADSLAGEAAPVVTVTPGRRYRLAALMVGGDPFPERSRVLAAWLPRPGEVFQPRQYREQVEGVIAECAELGFPFPAWLTREVQRDTLSAEVTVLATLVPGPRAVVGPQSSTLPPGRSSHFVVRAAGVGSGQLFRESDLARGVSRLQARDLYALVDPPLVHLTTSVDTVGIQWRVQPREHRNRVAVVLGLSRKAEGGSRISGQVDLDLPDLAGTGRRLSARWTDDGAERSRFGFSYLEPLILGTPLDTDIALENEVLQDQYTRFRVDNRWRMSVVALWGVEVGVGWDRSTYPTGDIERTTRARARVAILHSRADLTTSGWSALLAIESASRSTALRVASDDPDGLDGASDLGRQNSQRLLEADLAGEWWASPTVSLAGRASFRQIDTDVRPVPLPEQYRFGGANSLRGFREDEFRGETAAWGGLEVRLGPARRSRVYTFVDVGYFEFSVEDPQTAQVESRDGSELGFGAGLRTAMAAGVIDLAVGFPGNITFDTAKLHVSLVGAF
jgi:outer membrane protein assembly factor BamA